MELELEASRAERVKSLGEGVAVAALVGLLLGVERVHALVELLALLCNRRGGRVNALLAIPTGQLS